jgi:hypothetical protein
MDQIIEDLNQSVSLKETKILDLENTKKVMESDHQLKIETIEAELGAMKKDRDQAQIDFNE